MPALFTQFTREGRFWRWFEGAAAAIAARDLADPAIQRASQQDIAEQLSKIDRRLLPEVHYAAGEPHELIISADGVRSVAPIVRRLIDAAPQAALGRKGWVVTAFRQPQRLGPESSLSFEGSEIMVGDIWVMPRQGEKSGAIDLIIALPPAQADQRDAVKHGTFLLLDHCIGERTMIERIGFIDFVDAAPEPAAQGFTRLDYLSDRLRGF